METAGRGAGLQRHSSESSAVSQPVLPHVPRTIAARSSRLDRPAGKLARGPASGEDLPEDPGLLRTGSGRDGCELSPTFRVAVALEFGRRPLRREARLKEAINSGRGPQVGNVPGRQVILSGGEVLFPIL